MKEVYVEKIENFGYINLQTFNNKFVKISFNKIATEGFLTINKPNKLMNNFLKEFYNYLMGKKVDFNFPHILNVTKFQLKVYTALKSIKYGYLASYKELAEKIGNIHAYRAVGNACKANPLPLIIPCHRIIKNNGEIGGYSGGINLKKLFILIELKGANYGI